jgi:hypothetical protein
MGNIRQPMLKLKTHSVFHDLFLKQMYELEARLVIHAHFRNKLFIFLSDPILNNVQLCWPSWIYDPQKRAMLCVFS